MFINLANTFNYLIIKDKLDGNELGKPLDYRTLTLSANLLLYGARRNHPRLKKRYI